MNLNADFSQRVTSTPDAASWVASPLPGVTRRMLDRVGGEVARATSVVRYAPGSRFSAHVHGGGEEYLVLEGVFSDDSGDFGTGAYVRNPPGTSHAPHSEPGCVILVKLWQFDADDLVPVHLDTRSESGWSPVMAGVQRLALHAHAGVVTQMLRVARDVPVPLPDAGVELFVVEGALVEHDGTNHVAGSWIRAPRGLRPRLMAGTQGARLYLKTGGVGRDYMALP